MTNERNELEQAERGLALLWNGLERVNRGPKPSVTLDQIVRAGIKIADADGLEALSMRRVASELGIGTMTLYHYVPGKDELIDLMTDAVFGEGDDDADEEDDGSPGGPDGWRAEVEAFARHGWEMYRRHPWVMQTTMSRPPLGPNATRGMEWSLRAVDGLGLDLTTMLRVIGVVDSYVRGAALQVVNEVYAERRTGLSEEQWWATRGQLLEKVVGSGEFPMLARFGTEDVEHDLNKDFEFGLERVLNGIEEFIESRSETR